MGGSSRRNRDRRPARGAPSKEPRARILVVCEGEVTEPEYLQGFARWCRNPLVRIEISDEHGVPRTLVETAKRLKAQADRKATQEGDPFLRYDSVWCVFDVDEHPHVDQALDMANANEVHVALSNPCFELWLLLHFRESPGMRHRKAVHQMLTGFLPGYGKHLSFEVLEPGYEHAVRRAQRLADEAASANEVGRNPSTGVYVLTEAIRKFSR